mgnify:FL=1
MRLGILRCPRWFPGPMPPLCKGRWPGVSRAGGIDLLRFLRRTLAPLPGTLRWARFLPDEKSGKESPKAGPSPALWNPPRGTGSPCVLLFSALDPVGSHRWHGNSFVSVSFYDKENFYRQGLTLVCGVSAAESPASGDCQTQSLPCVKGGGPASAGSEGLTFSDFSGAPLRPCQGRSAYARFLPDEKSGKESPKAGPSPALWNPPRGTGSSCVRLFSALGLVGSHR